MKSAPVWHAYFGVARSHPIINNYLRSTDGRSHQVVLCQSFPGKWSRLWHLFAAMLRLRASKEKIIIHAHDFLSASLAGLLRFKAVVYDVHEIYECLARNSWQKFIVRSLDSFATKHAAILFYPSEHRRLYHLKGKHHESLVVENLFLPTNSVKPLAGPQEKRRVVRSTSGRRFLYGGTFTSVRCIEEIVAAFGLPALGDDTLFLAGRRNALLDDIVSGSSSNIVYLGELEHAEMISLLPEFDGAFALYKPTNANNRLAAPTKLFELAYFGVAVICTASPYVDDVIERLQLSNVLVLQNFGAESIAEVCSTVVRKQGEVKKRVREAVCWERQQGTIDEAYARLEREFLIQKHDTSVVAR